MCYADDAIDGAAEEEAGEGVENLGEEEGIDCTIPGERPSKYWKYQQFHKYKSFLLVFTPDQGVVKDGAENKKVVKDSESNQKPVEGIIHLLAGQDDDGDGVAQQPKQANRKLHIINENILEM